jgi:hypothetical protein
MKNSVADSPISESPNSGSPDFTATISLLFLLILVDLLFIGLHVLHVWSPWLKSMMYSLERDSGMAEQYQYIKQIWLAACLGVTFLQRRSRSFAGWALFFAFLLLDDALQIHERVGLKLGQVLGIPPMFGLRSDDFGEVIVAGVVGFAACVFAWLTIRRGGESSRRLSADLLCLLGALALFGVFFDVLHTITYFRLPSAAPVFALIEDGGEMLVVSVITAYVFDVLVNAGKIRVPVWPWVKKRSQTFFPGRG